MGEFELLKGKKKKKAEASKESELFGDLEVDLNSDFPVHEEFVDDKRLREMKKKIRKV
jgi:hypothetical protein